MDWILLIIIVVLLVWIGVSLAQHQLKHASRAHQELGSTTVATSPYQKMVDQHQAGWEAVRHEKTLIKRKQILHEAVQKGDHAQVKVQKSMMVFGKSVVNHLREKLKS